MRRSYRDFVGVGVATLDAGHCTRGGVLFFYTFCTCTHAANEVAICSARSTSMITVLFVGVPEATLSGIFRHAVGGGGLLATLVDTLIVYLWVPDALVYGIVVRIL